MDFLETIWFLVNCLDDLFTNPNGPILARNPSLTVIQFGKVPWACLSYHWNAKALIILGEIIIFINLGIICNTCYNELYEAAIMC